MFSSRIPLLGVFQVVIAAVASIVFFTISGLTLAGSTVALTVTAPLFIIFSPILIPATLTTAFLTTGFTAGATLGATAVALIMRLIKLRMGVNPKDNLSPAGASPTAEGASSTPSAQTLFQMPKFSGGYGGSWGGKPFSGTFGDKAAGGTAPAGGATPAGGSKPAGGFGGSWGGISWSGTIPGWTGTIPGWLGGTPTGGGNPADGAKPAGGNKPAGGGTSTW